MGLDTRAACAPPNEIHKLTFQNQTGFSSENGTKIRIFPNYGMTVYLVGGTDLIRAMILKRGSEPAPGDKIAEASHDAQPVSSGFPRKRGGCGFRWTAIAG